MRHTKLSRAISVSFFLCLASVAFAAPAIASPAGLRVYYTYGGFDPALMSFSQIERIMNFSRSGGQFSSSGYLMMVGGFIILSSIMAGATGFIKMTAGQQSSIFPSLAPIIFGFAIFIGCFVPKTSLIVYDPVLNKQSANALNLPVGIVYPAVLINCIERFVIDMYDNNATGGLVKYTDRSGLPQQYTTPALLYSAHGGAVGFDVFADSLSEFVSGSEASKTLTNYIKDCAMFEIVRPGGTLTQDELIAPPAGSTLMDVLEKASSNTNWTTTYLGGAPSASGGPVAAAVAGGDTRSCSEVYAELVDYYVTNAEANTKAALENACGARGFDPADSGQGGQCQNMLGDVIATSFPGANGADSVLPSNFISNNTVADITMQYQSSASPQVAAQFLALKQNAEQGSVMGVISGIVNPRMIDSYVAYTFFLIPLLAMFIPTPLCQKALGLILSLMLWNMLVRCLDVICFHMWVNEYTRAVASMGDMGQGVAAYFRLPLESSKHLKSFADLRSSVFLLATAISGALFKFGDSAMSRLADRASTEHQKSSTDMIDQGSRARAMQETATGAQRSQMLMSLAAGVGGMDRAAKGMAWNEVSGGATGAGQLDSTGGNAGVLAGKTSHNSNIKTTEGHARSDEMSAGQANTWGRISGAQAGATIKGLEKMSAKGADAVATAYNNTVQATMQNTAQSQSYDQMVSKFAKEAGITNSADAFKAFGALSLASTSGQMGAYFNAADGKGAERVTAAISKATEVASKSTDQSMGQVLGSVAAWQYMKDSGKIDQNMSYEKFNEGMSKFDTNMKATGQYAKEQAAFEMSKNFDNIKTNAADLNGSGLSSEQSRLAADKFNSAAGSTTEERRNSFLKAMEGTMSKDQAEKTFDQLSAAQVSKAEDLNAFKQGAAHLAGTLNAVDVAGGGKEALAKQETSVAQQEVNDRVAKAGMWHALGSSLGFNMDTVDGRKAFAASKAATEVGAAQVQTKSGLQVKSSTIMAADGSGAMKTIQEGSTNNLSDLRKLRSELNGKDGKTVKGMEHAAKFLDNRIKDAAAGKGATGYEFTIGRNANGEITSFDATRSGQGHAVNRQDVNSRDAFSSGSATLGGNSVVIDNQKQYLDGTIKRYTDENTHIQKSGGFVDVTLKDGTHRQGTGTVDPKTGAITLTDGKESQIIERSKVETIKDAKGNVVGEAAVKRVGDKHGTVAVHADGAQTYDASTVTTIGTAVTSVQNLAGSASDGSLAGGTPAVAVAVGERSVSVAAEKINQVTSVIGGVAGIKNSARATGDEFSGRTEIKREAEHKRNVDALARKAEVPPSPPPPSVTPSPHPSTPPPPSPPSAPRKTPASPSAAAPSSGPSTPVSRAASRAANRAANRAAKG